MLVIKMKILILHLETSKQFMLRLIFLILISSLSTAGGVLAQKKVPQLKAKVDSILDNRYFNSKYDTNYISRPLQRLTLKLRANLSGNEITSERRADGETFRSKLSTDNRLTFSVGASYRGLSASLSLNPASLSGKDEDFELNVSYYSNKISLDVSYQEAKTLNGDYESQDQTVHLDKGSISMKMFTFAGNYTFNHRQFSFPAAFTQSYIQRRSAGSWLAGISYQGIEIKNASDELHGLPQMRIFIGNFAIGGGYGYNFVVKKWLFHLSAMPTLIIVNRNNTTVNGERYKTGYHFPEMIFNHRLAIVHNFNERFFFAATSVINLTTFHSSDYFVVQDKWKARATFGFRL